jgi:hypothetical protein
VLGRWKCDIKGPERTVTWNIVVAKDSAHFAQVRVPMPVTWFGNEARFQGNAPDGRLITYVLAPAGGQASLTVSGRKPARLQTQLSTRNVQRPVWIEEFVLRGPCVKQKAGS